MPHHHTCAARVSSRASSQGMCGLPPSSGRCLLHPFVEAKAMEGPVQPCELRQCRTVPFNTDYDAIVVLAIVTYTSRKEPHAPSSNGSRRSHFGLTFRVSGLGWEFSGSKDFE